MAGKKGEDGEIDRRTGGDRERIGGRIRLNHDYDLDAKKKARRLKKRTNV